MTCQRRRRARTGLAFEPGKIVTIKIETDDLKDKALNWAAAVALGYSTGHLEDNENSLCVRMPNGALRVICGTSALDVIKLGGFWQPTEDWSQAGILIEKFGLFLRETDDPNFGKWSAGMRYKDNVNVTRFCERRAESPTEAATKVVVRAILGETIEVPAPIARVLGLSEKAQSNVVDLNAVKRNLYQERERK